MKKRFISKCLLVAMIAVLAGFFACQADAGAKAKYNWRLSSPWTRPIMVKIYTDFVNRVEKYTDGEVKIKVYPDGTIGNMEESFKSVQLGDIEISQTAPYVDVVPGGGISFIPWAVSSYAEYEKAFDIDNGIVHKVLTKAYDEVGMKVIFHVTTGGYGLSNNVREIKTPADLKNIRFRVSSSKGVVMALGNMGKGTGMTMETIPMSEVYNSLSRKVIDGCWNSIGSITAERLYEVMKYHTELNWFWDASQVSMNKDLWEELPKNIQDGILKAARESQKYATKLQKESDAKGLETIKKNGMKVYFPTAQEKEAFFKASNVEAVWNEILGPWLNKAYPNENMVKKIQAELAANRKKLAAK
ncbi:MAG: TRAP transporter substrate-binding protein [Synergistaceae bacterium]|nr:TRAP transporter substrate-binding protein [Synergistaceae bacterium]